LPFWTPSKHEGFKHVAFTHTLDAQSCATPQARPVPHAWHVPPPQSTSVSVPFLIPSKHEGAWQMPIQAPDVQSEPVRQVTPFAHGGHVPPPQSIPVSLPFKTPSEHEGTWHTFPEQKPDWQSDSLTQPPPMAQAGQDPPPQSMPVSAPSLMPSLHVEQPGLLPQNCSTHLSSMATAGSWNPLHCCSAHASHGLPPCVHAEMQLRN
jgi:hypothetical protein